MNELKSFYCVISKQSESVYLSKKAFCFYKGFLQNKTKPSSDFLDSLTWAGMSFLSLKNFSWFRGWLILIKDNQKKLGPSYRLLSSYICSKFLLPKNKKKLQLQISNLRLCTWHHPVNVFITIGDKFHVCV